MYILYCYNFSEASSGSDMHISEVDDEATLTMVEDVFPDDEPTMLSMLSLCENQHISFDLWHPPGSLNLLQICLNICCKAKIFNEIKSISHAGYNLHPEEHIQAR